MKNSRLVKITCFVINIHEKQVENSAIGCSLCSLLSLRSYLASAYKSTLGEQCTLGYYFSYMLSGLKWLVHGICSKLLDLTSAIHSLTFALNFHGKIPFSFSLTHPSHTVVSSARYYSRLMLILCWLFSMDSYMQFRNFYRGGMMIWTSTNGVLDYVL